MLLLLQVMASRNPFYPSIEERASNQQWQLVLAAAAGIPILPVTHMSNNPHTAAAADARDFRNYIQRAKNNIV
jgi:hypothetical protein